MFETDEYPELPEAEKPIVEDPTNKEEVTHAKKIYESRITKRDENLYKMEIDKLALHSILWNAISDESRTAIMNETEWLDYESDRDLLKFWRLIKQTHTGGINGHENPVLFQEKRKGF